MTLAADMSTTDSEPEFELVEDSVIVFLPKALPVLLRINFVKKPPSVINFVSSKTDTWGAFVVNTKFLKLMIDPRGCSKIITV